MRKAVLLAMGVPARLPLVVHHCLSLKRTAGSVCFCVMRSTDACPNFSHILANMWGWIPSGQQVRSFVHWAWVAPGAWVVPGA